MLYRKEILTKFKIYFKENKQRLIGEYEQKLNYAHDFTPHKVEYYKELLNQAKNLFK